MVKDETAEGFDDLIQSPGEMLRQARLSKQLSIGEISKETRISRAMIEALENGENKQLPGRTYENSYIKLICKMTGHDPQPILKKWSEEFYPNEDLSTYIFPEAKVKEDNSYIGLIGLFLALIIIASYGAWYLYSVQNISDEEIIEKNKVNETENNIENDDGIKEEFLISESNKLNSDISNALNSDQVSSIEDNKQNNNSSDTESSINNEQNDELENNGNNSLEKQEIDSNENINSNIENSENSIGYNNLNLDNTKNLSRNDSLETKFKDVFLTGLDDSWVQIAYDDGEIFFSGMLKKGEKVNFPNDNNLNISLGNAGAVGIEYDSFNLIAVGAIGEIIQSVKIKDLLLNIQSFQLN